MPRRRRGGYKEVFFGPQGKETRYITPEMEEASIERYRRREEQELQAVLEYEGLQGQPGSQGHPLDIADEDDTHRHTIENTGSGSGFGVGIIGKKPAPQLGWIGLGNMSLAMAKSLQRHIVNTEGVSLSYTNRIMSRGASLEALGGRPCETVAELVQNADIIFTSICNSNLSNDSALLRIALKIPTSKGLAGKVVVDTSTVCPKTSVQISKKLGAAGAYFIAARVFGSTPVAERGQLLFAVTGPDAAIDAISPYLEGILARQVIKLGKQIAKAGLSPPSGERKGAYSNLAVKDIGHGIRCAESVGTRLEVAKVALAHLEEARKFVDGQDSRNSDSSWMYSALRQHAGLDFGNDLLKAKQAKE